MRRDEARKRGGKGGEGGKGDKKRRRREWERGCGKVGMGEGGRGRDREKEIGHATIGRGIKV